MPTCQIFHVVKLRQEKSFFGHNTEFVYRNVIFSYILCNYDDMKNWLIFLLKQTKQLEHL